MDGYLKRELGLDQFLVLGSETLLCLEMRLYLYLFLFRRPCQDSVLQSVFGTHKRLLALLQL